LQEAGYHVCTYSHPPDEGNPIGYFEDLGVIMTNEAILAQFYHTAWRRISRKARGKPDIVATGPWLLDLDHRRLKDVRLRSDHADRFRNLFARTPFAYKDPRFSFTLKAIAPLIPADTVYICVFRHPLPVVESTKKQALRSGLILDDQYCLAVWEAHYRCLLEHYRTLGGQWLFISYEQLMDGLGVPRLEKFLKIRLDKTLIQPELDRTRGYGTQPDKVAQLFEELKALSGSTSDKQHADQPVRMA
jgi:hypothetical protein